MTGKTPTTIVHRAEVFDGRGVAHIWAVEVTRRGREVSKTFVGSAYGVHTEAEAIAAWKADQQARGRVV